MERLTLNEAIKHAKEVADMNYNDAEKFDSNGSVENYMKANCMKCAEEHEQLVEWLEKLKFYKEAEEQGLLVRLPCKVGDTVYRVNAGAKQPIIPMTVSEIHFLCYKNERAVRFDAIGKEDMGESCYRLEDIGRIVFLTREEAEKKLEEMKNDKT